MSTQARWHCLGRWDVLYNCHDLHCSRCEGNSIDLSWFSVDHSIHSCFTHTMSTLSLHLCFIKQGLGTLRRTFQFVFQSSFSLSWYIFCFSCALEIDDTFASCCLLVAILLPCWVVAFTTTFVSDAPHKLDWGGEVDYWLQISQKHNCQFRWYQTCMLNNKC